MIPHREQFRVISAIQGSFIFPTEKSFKLEPMISKNLGI